MLNKLSIKNIALIESVEIDFKKGLNVLSGETGSGKSVIIESLNFVLGAKADKSLIRSGENESLVCAEFDVKGCNGIFEVFDDLDFEHEDTLIITRKFNLDGKSSIKVNGNTVTSNMLKKFTSKLVDVHGQSEHFELLNTSNQLKLIDNFGDENILNIKSPLKTVYSEYKDLLNEIDELGGNEGQRAIRLDILNYQIDEINKANIKEDEEKELLIIKEKLNNYEKISNALAQIKESVSEEGGINDILSNTLRGVKSISGLSDEYAKLCGRIDNIYNELDDISSCAIELLDGLDVGEYNIEYVEERLETIKKIKKKYGGSYEEIHKFFNDAVLEKEKLENFNENAQKLLIKKKEYEKTIFDLYVKLRSERIKVADNFSKNILSELRELGMPNANFQVKFNEALPIDICKFNSANGYDEIEFLFSANLGEPLKPLSQIISGGEMSRFMLSIKAQTAKYNEIGTFIFDEIDAGISGKTARVVAEKFARISQNTQVIAITHLPQISSFADNNILISKHEKSDKTYTDVVELCGEEKINEIIRLIGGKENDVSAKELAKTLITEGEEYKKSIGRKNV